MSIKSLKEHVKKYIFLKRYVSLLFPKNNIGNITDRINFQSGVKKTVSDVREHFYIVLVHEEERSNNFQNSMMKVSQMY